MYLIIREVSIYELEDGNEGSFLKSAEDCTLNFLKVRTNICIPHLRNNCFQQ